MPEFTVTEEDRDLRAKLTKAGLELQTKKKPALSAKQERIIAGFEEIQIFVEQHGREPTFAYEENTFERLYANRLEQIRRQPESIALLKERDHQDLLDARSIDGVADADNLEGEALLAALGLRTNNDADITTLRHIKPRAEVRQPAEEIAQRTPCKDFHTFKPLFEKVQADINNGARKLVPFKGDSSSIKKGNFFVLGGQKAYIAEVGARFTGAADGRDEYRLRVIFDNGVEGNHLLRSLQKRLWEDENGRRITDLSMGPLFDDQPQAGDIASGVIYVCRSRSDHPKIKENRTSIHKIGVTGGDPEDRLSGAEDDPTFLFAKADLVASFELFNINRNKLETILHKVFADARLEIEIPDRFGKPCRPQEWFCVPLETIKDAVDKIKDRTITKYQFNVKTGLLEEDT